MTTLVPDVSVPIAGGPVPPTHPAAVEARLGAELQVTPHLLECRLSNSDREIGGASSEEI